MKGISYCILAILFILGNILSISVQSTSSPIKTAYSPIDESYETEKVLSYLRFEAAALQSAQQRVSDILRSKNIAVGIPSGQVKRADSSTSGLEIARSTERHPLECRVSLEQVPPGMKCIAPCACTGSQKWVQFSLLNRLRRKNPGQWQACPVSTTGQPLLHSIGTAVANQFLVLCIRRLVVEA